MTWKFNEDKFTVCWYGMVTSRDILNNFFMDLKISKHTIECGIVPHQGCMVPILNLRYLFFLTTEHKDAGLFERFLIDSYTYK